MAFYGLSIASGDLGGNLYINFFLIVLIEIPSDIAATISCNYFGRKKTIVSATILGSLHIFVIAFIPIKRYGKPLRTTIGVAGRFLLSIAYTSKYVWTAEIYPTTMRAKANGFMLTLAPLGGTAAPWIAKYSSRIHPTAPFILMSAITFIAGIAMLGLPETKGQSTAELDVPTRKASTSDYGTVR